MIEKLNELVALLRERQVVKQLSETEGIERIQVFERERKALSKELKAFKRQSKRNVEKKIYAVYRFRPENVLEICIVCMMTGIKDDDIFLNWEDIPIALRQIEGELKPIAENFAKFIGSEPNDDNDYFSFYTLPKLLEMLFG